MTSTIRVSEMKSGKVHGNKSGDGKPRPGTPLREKYDRLRMGEVVVLGKSSKRQLTDFYGMDIERVGSIGSRLIGEWDGPYYIPVERIVSSLMEPV